MFAGKDLDDDVDVETKNFLSLLELKDIPDPILKVYREINKV